MAASRLPGGVTKLRSTYLQKVAKLQDEGAVRRFWTRLVLVLGIGFLLGLFWFTLRSRILPREIGLPFYELHDFVLLRIIGYTFTLFFPWSLIWWGVAAVMLTIWLISFVRNRSLLRPFYLCLCRLVLGEQVFGLPLLPFQSTLADWMVITSHALRGMGYRPALFENVAQHEYLKTLHELVTAEGQKARSRQAERLQKFAALRIKLRVPRNTKSLTVDHLQASVLWSEVMVYTRYFGSSQFLGTFLELEGRFTSVMNAASRHASPSLSSQSEPHFDLSGLADNLRDMARLASAANTPVVQWGARIRLIQAARVRQSFLEEFIRRFRSPDRLTHLDSTDKNLLHMQNELQHVPPDQVRFFGRLALDVAEFAAKGIESLQVQSSSSKLDAALAKEMPELAFGAVEAFEAFDFILSSWPSRTTTSLSTDSIYAQLQRMMMPTPIDSDADGVVHRQTPAYLPSEQDYLVCMKLAEAWYASREEAAKAALRADKESQDEKLRDRALALIQMQELRLRLARGPSPRGEM